MSVNDTDTSRSRVYPKPAHITNRDENFNSSQFRISESSDSESATTKSSNRDRVIQTIFDLVAIVLIFVAFILIYSLVNPSIAYFYCNDTDIFYPYKPDTVELWVVALYGILAPVLFIVLTELKNSKLINFDSPKRNSEKTKSKLRTYFICIFHAISLFLLGLAVTLLITELGKRWIGRLRPHFMSVCNPNFSQVNCTINGLNGFVYNSVSTGDSFCTGDAKMVKEARLSFPSGHSSFSCYTMLFLILYLEARLNLLRFRYVKSLIQIGALIAAYITCISRVSDFHHRGSDVIGGAIIGIVIALFTTLVTGRVLWEYKINKKITDFDFKN